MGRFTIPPDKATDPLKGFGARDVDANHVFQIEGDILRTATKPEHLLCVIINDDLYQHAARGNCLGNQKQDPMTYADLCKIVGKTSTSLRTPIYTIRGNHTRRALINLIARHPTNTMVKTCEARVMVCPDIDETYDNITSLGIIDNAHVRKESGYREHTKGMHYRTLARGMLKKPDAIAAEKARVAQKANIDKTTVGKWWQVSKLQGRLWFYAERMLSDDFGFPDDPRDADDAPYPCLPAMDNVNNKVPNSIKSWDVLGFMDDTTVGILLHSVYRNHITWKQLELECAKYKIMERLKVEGAKFLSGRGHFSAPQKQKNKDSKGRSIGGRVSVADQNKAWKALFNKHVMEGGTDAHAEVITAFLDSWATNLARQKLKKGATITESYFSSLQTLYHKKQNASRQDNPKVLVTCHYMFACVFHEEYCILSGRWFCFL